jgi:polysaccharide pyruvyl transferase WcaK-like protein
VGINNFGDELLAQLYAHWIRESSPGSTVTHLEVDGRGILSRETCERIRRADCLIFTGGGYFADGDYASTYSLRRHLRAIRNRRVYWRVFKEAARQAVPCAVVGVEVGPLANPLYRDSVRRILSAARDVVVRNTESAEYAQGLCGKSFAVNLDAALSGDFPPHAAAASLPAAQDEFKIGLHVHSLDGELSAADCTAMVERILSQLPPDREAKFFYFHDQRKKGAHPSRSVRAEEHFVSEYAGTTAIAYSTPEETARSVAGMDLLVTSKLHLGIVARSKGVPVLAIGGHPKIRRFYESIGEGAACGSPPAFATAGLPAFIADHLGGEAGARIPVANAARESALANRSFVASVVGSLKT